MKIRITSQITSNMYLKLIIYSTLLTLFSLLYRSSFIWPPWAVQEANFMKHRCLSIGQYLKSNLQNAFNFAGGTHITSENNKILYSSMMYLKISLIYCSISFILLAYNHIPPELNTRSLVFPNGYSLAPSALE